MGMQMNAAIYDLCGAVISNYTLIIHIVRCKCENISLANQKSIFEANVLRTDLEIANKQLSLHIHVKCIFRHL